MIVFINGAFGIGKSTLARELRRRIPRSGIYNPEPAGIALQLLALVTGEERADFQDIGAWTPLTVAGIRLFRTRYSTVLVPMGISNESVLEALMRRSQRFDPDVRHYCLTAPLSVVHDRLRSRGSLPMKNPWEYRRAEECCEAHQREFFEVHVDTTGRSVDRIAETILADLRADHPAITSAG